MSTKKVPSARTATPRKSTPRTLAQIPADAAVLRPTDDQIRLRAYQLFLQRDGHGGDPLEDWLRAESELMSTISVVPAVKTKTAPRAASRRSAS
jgi:hypothetical protein